MATKLSKQKFRCSWCESSPEMQHYHDTEWGVPVHDDSIHFEFLILEGAQAGLSWSTILKKRAGYKKAFANFNVKKVAGFTKQKENKLLLSEDIVRNKLKVASTVTNAKSFMAIQKEFGSFDKYIWAFVKNKPLKRLPKSSAEIPAQTEISDTISKDLKKRGFKFVGSTIIYAYMQAVGLVNDHVAKCDFR